MAASDNRSKLFEQFASLLLLYRMKLFSKTRSKPDEFTHWNRGRRSDQMGQQKLRQINGEK